MNNEESIFHEAIKRSPASRSAYLDEACAGNASLRQTIERLLAAHDASGGLLDRRLSEHFPTEHHPVTEAAGTQIGPYKLLEQIGEGGMGVVYMADQQSPVRRRVALKVIKPGMDSGQVVARFEAERQALAMMDHPNIARVFDAGTTESGRPYFVMELVRGLPITEYCDLNNLAVHERLALLIQVCQAVQHAHQKGIIHRDLKPSNVMVTMHDGSAVPKVIDFGVVKALNQQLTERTLFTNFAQMIGTPLYMSPEQAELSGLDVDTRSDVYSLGVLLYELLTGGTPFDKARFRDAAFDEVRRIIREEEPQRPSTRISTSGERRTAIAAHRKADPQRLSQLIRGDLDWIVMKSLEKDRNRRYETADGLARDIQRYLNDQPVEATPPTPLYRFRKLARRNRTVLVSGALLFVALAIGAAASTWQAVRATRAEQVAEKARSAEAEQRQHEQHARREAELQRKAADAQREQTERALYAAHLGRAKDRWDTGDVDGVSESLAACSSSLRGWEYDYLFNLTTARIVPKADFFVHAPISPDWSLCIPFGSNPRTVSEIRTGQPVASLEQPQEDASYRKYRFTPGSRFVLGSAEDCRDVIWNATTGKIIGTLPNYPDKQAFAISPDGHRIAYVLEKGTIAVCSLPEGREELSITARRGPDERAHARAEARSKLELMPHWGYDIAFSSDGSRIVSGPWDDTIKVWDAATGSEVVTLAGKCDSIESLLFSPDDQRIACIEHKDDEKLEGEQIGLIRGWDAATGEQLFTRSAESVRQPIDGDKSLMFSPDSQNLTAHWWYGGQIRFWDATTGGERSANPPLKLGRGETCVAISADGQFIAMNDVDGIVHIFDSKTLEEIYALKGTLHKIPYGIHFSRDGTELITDITIWNLRALIPLSLPRHPATSGANCVEFLPDGKHLVTSPSQAAPTIWDAASGERLAELESVRGNCLALSAAGKEIAIGTKAGITFWDVEEHSHVRTLRTTGEVSRVCYSCDDKTVASVVTPCRIVVWNHETDTEIWSREAQDLGDIAISPDGKQLACGGGLIKLFDIVSGKLLRTIDANVASVVFSPDGRRIAGIPFAGDTIGVPLRSAVDVYDIASGDLATSLRGHANDVLSLSFSPDGQRIATGAGDSTIKIWDAESGYELLTLREERGFIVDLAFSPDGKRLGSANSVLGVKIWDATQRQPAEKR